MKRKYITTSVLLACLSKSNNWKKDIHTHLKKTLGEHRKIMRELQILSQGQDYLFRENGKEAA